VTLACHAWASVAAMAALRRLGGRGGVHPNPAGPGLNAVGWVLKVETVETVETFQPLYAGERVLKKRFIICFDFKDGQKVSTVSTVSTGTLA
jgi:hypothetical protein